MRNGAGAWEDYWMDVILVPLVLRLYAKSKDGTFAVKTFLEYSDEKARSRMQLCRISSSQHSIDAVKRDLDPFLAEARAFEQIAKFCPTSCQAYFPRYHGVITDISRSKYPSPYKLRPRAVALESISPDLASRRILSAESHVPYDILEGVSQKLEKLNLSPFEKNHGDVFDRHFRLPGDFYDTVLYDFSIAYTFSPSLPYRMNFRSPASLSRTRKRDRAHVEHDILGRAENMDFRSYLSKTLQMSSDAIEAIFSMPAGEALDLELIILKVMHQPDGSLPYSAFGPFQLEHRANISSNFGLSNGFKPLEDFNAPSLASVFPFLEAIRPEGHLTWHIGRAQDLNHYVVAWVAHVDDSGASENMTMISFAGEKCSDKDTFPAGLTFYLILIPQTWNKEEIAGKLLEACARLDTLHKPGIVITKDEFYHGGHGSGEDEAQDAQQPADASAPIPTAPS